MRFGAWASMGMVFAGACPGLAQPPRFEDTPLVTAPNPGPFRELFQRARCETVRLVILGDSQETSPGGQGAIYIPRFQYELFLRYANVPETAVAQMMATTGGGLPFAEFLLRGAHPGNSVTATRLGSTLIPPGMIACKTSALGASTANGNQQFGQLVMLQTGAQNVDPAAQIPPDVEYFHAGDQVDLEIIAPTYFSSGEVRVYAKPHSSSSPSFFAPVTQTIDSTMGLERPGLMSILTQRLGPIETQGMPFLQVELAGTDPAKLTDILGARFISRSDPRGISVTSLSAGGYTTRSIPTLHSICGPVINALRPDAIVLMYGANDVSNFTSPEQYRANLQALIAFVRTATRADLPVILVADPYRSATTQSQADALDRYPGACHEIALADPLVAAVNSRRALNDLGWSAGGAAPFLFDSVHYTPHGGITKARVDVSLMYDAFLGDRTPCVGDVTGDCAVTIDDLIEYLALFEDAQARADVDDGSSTGTLDQGVTIDDLLYYLDRFSLGC